MKGKRRKVAIGIASVAVVLVLGLVWVLVFRENPDYKDGVRQLQAGNYEAAESAFRLCLERVPGHSGAKGLLAYSVFREDLQDRPRAETTTAALVGQFVDYYTVVALRDKVAGVKNDKLREDLLALFRPKEQYLKDLFRDKRIPFRDWDDFAECMEAAAKVIFATAKTADDPLSQAAKDFAAALLARQGDQEAAAYLLDRCANNPELLVLTLVAGESLRTSLEQELARKGSFIREESASALRLLGLLKLLREFEDEHGQVRLLHEGDLPADQAQLAKELDERTLERDEALLAKLEALDLSRAHPLSIHLLNADLGGGKWLTCLWGYCLKEGSVVANFYYWDGKAYNPVTIAMQSESESGAGRATWVQALPLGEVFVFHKDRSVLRVAVRKMQQVTRERLVNGQQAVVRSRWEERYDPYYGGFRYVRVPFLSVEAVSHVVAYKDWGAGNVMHEFAWSEGERTLRLQRKTWVEDGAFASTPPPLEGAQPGPVIKDEKDAGFPPATMPEGGSGVGSGVDALSAAAASRALTDEELGCLSPGDLGLLRNAIYARHGYIFKRADLRQYFSTRSWYRPRTSSVDAAGNEMTSVEKANVARIKAREGG